MTKTLAFFLAAGFTLLTFAGYGQTPISAAPYVISTPGNYILTTNLAYGGSTGNAITVNSSYVTIDLNGYFIWCSANGNSARAIYTGDTLNVTIKNGTIVNFYVGVWLDSPGATNVNKGHVVDGVRLTGDSFGVYAVQSSTVVVKNCQINDGYYGIVFQQGTGNRAVNNTVYGSTGAGLYSSGQNYFESNYLAKCGTGIFLGSLADKYRFNAFDSCTTNVTGGTEEFAGDL